MVVEQELVVFAVEFDYHNPFHLHRHRCCRALRMTTKTMMNDVEISMISLDFVDFLHESCEVSENSLAMEQLQTKQEKNRIFV